LKQVDGEDLLPVVHVREAERLDVALRVVERVVALGLAEAVRAAVEQEAVARVECPLLGLLARGELPVEEAGSVEPGKGDDRVGALGHRGRRVVLVLQAVVVCRHHRVDAEDPARSVDVPVDVARRPQDLARTRVDEGLPRLGEAGGRHLPRQVRSSRQEEHHERAAGGEERRPKAFGASRGVDRALSRGDGTDGGDRLERPGDGHRRVGGLEDEVRGVRAVGADHAALRVVMDPDLGPVHRQAFEALLEHEVPADRARHVAHEHQVRGVPGEAESGPALHEKLPRRFLGDGARRLGEHAELPAAVETVVRSTLRDRGPSRGHHRRGGDERRDPEDPVPVAHGFLPVRETFGSEPTHALRKLSTIPRSPVGGPARAA
jgi:hypothetical protein